MIEQLADVPVGTVGLRASGKLGKDDYRLVLEPALRQEVESGELRLVFVLTDFEGLEPGVWVDDLKMGLQVVVRDHSAWKRFALVTDVSWVAKATHLFAWMTPGEVRIFGLGELEEAQSWVAG